MADTKETFTHPSFGLVGISRAQGSTNLYGSELRHQHFIILRIKEAETRRELQRDWHYGHKTVAEIWLSDAQYAEMITSPNIGNGVPCTIRYIQGDEDRFELVRGVRPEPPTVSPITQHFKEEVDNKTEKMQAAVTDAIAKIENLMNGTLKPNKTNFTEIRSDLWRLKNELGSNIKFVITSMKETMEKIVQQAKTEFETHVNMSLEHRGLSQFKDQAPKLELGTVIDAPDTEDK